MVRFHLKSVPSGSNHPSLPARERREGAVPPPARALLSLAPQNSDTLPSPARRLPALPVLPTPQIFARVVGALGGRAAEEVIFGDAEVTSGASGDLQQVTNMARQMVINFGMSDIGPWSLLDPSAQQGDMIMRMMARNSMSENLQQRIDDAVKKIATEAYEIALSQIRDNRCVRGEERGRGRGEGERGTLCVGSCVLSPALQQHSLWCPGRLLPAGTLQAHTHTCSARSPLPPVFLVRSEAIDAITETLLEKETISGDEFRAMLATYTTIPEENLRVAREVAMKQPAMAIERMEL